MLECILPTITANDPELTEILQTVERIFPQPLRSPNPPLRLEKVENFIRFDSMTRMWMSCGLNANGLNSILSAQPDDNESTSLGDTIPSPLGALSYKLPADPLADIDNDDEAIYNVQEILR
ncbi:MAG: hypothetical protein Q9184_003052 [Pyrenodesmia sp. 2 TL-2023]